MMKDNMLLYYQQVRNLTEQHCAPLEKEDYVVQPSPDVSPPKWHLGHTAWFFETVILKQHLPDYPVFDYTFDYVFNSYYETVGSRVIRTDRGNLSRPTVDHVYEYRKHVDHYMQELIKNNISEAVIQLIILGLNHEQQHQELLLSDIKFILGHNPLFPAYKAEPLKIATEPFTPTYLRFNAGVYQIGYQGTGFAYDNEFGSHQVYLENFEIASHLVTNREYMEFMDHGGYEDFRFWHAAGWERLKQIPKNGPLYWHLTDGIWQNYTLEGLMPVKLDAPVNHVSFYEAYAYASWKGARLPTEFEWEVASSQLTWGERWEWTQSAYLPYPRFKIAEGIAGEYNGKFMVGQQVLRGSSEITSPGHSRPTYRNFFQPEQQWQYTGIRLAF
jgi:ergothioneine biosynthesis protein EgtB